MASATGGLTSGVVWTFDRLGRKRKPALDIEAVTSVLTITDRKVTHWRDYLDPVAVFDALGWPSR